MSWVVSAPTECHCVRLFYVGEHHPCCGGAPSHAPPGLPAPILREAYCFCLACRAVCGLELACSGARLGGLRVELKGFGRYFAQVRHQEVVYRVVGDARAAEQYGYLEEKHLRVRGRSTGGQEGQVHGRAAEGCELRKDADQQSCAHEYFTDGYHVGEQVRVRQEDVLGEIGVPGLNFRVSACGLGEPAFEETRYRAACAYAQPLAALPFFEACRDELVSDEYPDGQPQEACVCRCGECCMECVYYAFHL